MAKRLLNKSELAPRKGFKSILRTKSFRIPALTLVLMMLAAGISLSDADVVAYAAQGDYTVSTQSVQTQTSQSPRWVGSADRWQVSDNAGGFIKNCWYQDEVSGQWFMIGAEDGTVMYAGLITDQSTGKSYLLNTNHDGSYGAMLTTDGVYNLNGKQVYLQFDQAHQGSFGAVLSGLSEARQAGVGEKQLSSIPTANANEQTPPQKEDKKDNTSNPVDDALRDAGITDEVMEEIISGSGSGTSGSCLE